VTPKQRLLGQSALQAFRSDIVPGAPEGTAEDQATILVATLLRQSLAAEDSAATVVREKAIELARSSLGEVTLSEGCTYDDFPARSQSDVIRLLSQRTDHSGRLHLAQHLLESAAAIETDSIDSGRILDERVRVSRKLGFLDLALEQCQQLLREGRRLRSPELTVKAHLAFAALADTRGNYVEYRARLRTGIRIAKTHELQRLCASAYTGLATSNALMGKYGDAVAYFWKAYELSGGKGHIAQAALGNLGQTLLISGRPAEARKVATIVLQTAPGGTVAPLLGMFAIASAQLGDEAGVRWAAGQMERVSSGTGNGNAREIAEALTECSAALEGIGERSAAGAMRRRSEEMAARFGFHGLTFKEAVQSVQRLADPPAFNQAAAKATAAIDEMEVPRIPELAAALPT
jgi:tetratricopeptide (TPR) repeat protein